MDEYNLRDYSIYRIIINMFFTLNLEICKILQFMIRSYNLTYLQQSYNLQSTFLIQRSF